MSREPHDPTRPGLGRRAFLRGAAASGLAALPVGGAAAASVPSAAQVPPAEEGFELAETTVDELQAAMSAGQLTASEVTQLYLGRIEALDRRGPGLRSVIETNPDALAIAAARDRERAAGTSRGPLHGVPILLKDNIDTADRMTTTAGSLALEGSTPLEDSDVAYRLRRAGAVILGKANLSEWANFRSNRSSSGWSARGGQCRNPYQLDRNPCGSSSGSGVAVSANLTALAVGTETDGSIVCPASANGVVGLKPTVGLVSRTGVVPIAHSQDTAGPMTRTVRDAAILLGALAGVDPRDAATHAAPPAPADYTIALEADRLRGARVGVARRYFGAHEAVDALMEEALQAMRDAGAVLVDPVSWPERAGWGESEYEVLVHEFKADLNAYLATRGADTQVRTLADVIAFNETHRDREMPYFGQEVFEDAETRGALTDARYLQALETSRRLGREDGIDAVMDAHELDAIVAPSGGPAWTTDLVNGDHFVTSSSRPAATAGYPNVSVPAGFVHGLPVGLSLFGRAWSEATLLGLAFAFEQATGARRPPRFLSTLDASPQA